MSIFDKSKLATASPAPAEARPLIMIVDDEDANLQVLTNVLEEKFSLIQAVNGQDALEKLFALPPDRKLRAILADQRMPVMCGTELLERALAHDPDIVRILITGYADMDSMVDSINRAQIYRYISKPFNIQDLLLTVQRAVEALELREAKEKAEAEARSHLERINEALSSANTLKDLFLATVSHELRTPMHGVVGNLEMMSSLLLRPEIRPYLDEARDSALHMRRMLDDILLFTEIQSGSHRLAMSDFSLRDAIEAECELARSACAAKGLAFACRIEPAVPDGVRSDRTLLPQMLRYLLSNAVKFTEAGHVALELAVLDAPAPTPPGDFEPDASPGKRVTLQLRVADSGIGIDQAHQSALFEYFNQGNKQFNRRHGGLGLGLALCKQLAELLQGQIRFESTLGQGSLFEVRLPILALRAGSTVAAEQRPPSPPVLPSSAPRVLVVDDNQVNRKVIEAMLRRLGCNTTSAENGEEAVAAASAGIFDIILMDCQMPVMDGFSATAAIKATAPHRHTPVVAFTANAAQCDRDRASEAGMCDLLQKPVTLPELSACLSKWLGPVEKAPHASSAADADGGDTGAADAGTRFLNWAADLAHEINNPNNVTSASAQRLQLRLRELQQFIEGMLSDDADIEIRQAFASKLSELRAQAMLIQSGSQRVEGIVRNMRLQARGELPARARVSPVSLLKESAELVAALHAADVHFDLEALSPAGEVMANAEQLGQVFSNLITNACHAIEAQARAHPGFAGTVRCASRQVKDGIELVIQDNGPGMSEETRARLFDRYFTTKGEGRGTGLGMGISKSIVEAHGGRLDVASEEGAGTRVSVWLPRLA